MTRDGETFTEDDVADDFVQVIDYKVVQGIGWHSLRAYEWAPDQVADSDLAGWPFVVVRDGREFEVDIDVRAVELTPERKAAREAETDRIVAELQRRQQRAAES